MFFVLSTLTTLVLYPFYGLLVIVQALLILIASFVGEHIVSSWGYYHYTDKNNFFIGNVPVSIPLFWVFFIQMSLIVSKFFLRSDSLIVFVSALILFLLDLLFLEPFLSKRKKYWVWTPKEKGMFHFIPEEINNFTAPFGNYFTWFVFPVLMNTLLVFGIKYIGICL